MAEEASQEATHKLVAESVECKTELSRPNLRVKRTLALAHIKNAAKRSDELARLEQEHKDEAFGPVLEDLTSEWLSAIISSAAGMEAYVNELIDGQGQDPGDPIWGRRSPTRKAKCFVSNVFSRDLDIGSEPFQSAQAVHDLRNKIMHFRPYFDDQNETSQELERTLPNLETCFLVDEGAPFFPVRCVSSAYSNWAVVSALSFIKEVDRVVGEDRFNKHFRGVAETLFPIHA